MNNALFAEAQSSVLYSTKANSYIPHILQKKKKTPKLGKRKLVFQSPNQTMQLYIFMIRISGSSSSGSGGLKGSTNRQTSWEATAPETIFIDTVQFPDSDGSEREFYFGIFSSQLPI